jgi:hypothetical protein
LGVPYSARVRVRSLIDGSEWEQPYTYEFAFAWARAMIGLYRTAERNEVFKMVSLRSAEVDCINTALDAGVSQDDLRRAASSRCWFIFDGKNRGWPRMPNRTLQKVAGRDGDQGDHTPGPALASRFGSVHRSAGGFRPECSV